MGKLNTNLYRNHQTFASENLHSEGNEEKTITGFTRVPNAVIFDTALSDVLFRTLIALFSYQYGKNGKSFPSQIEVANKLGKTRQTINQHVGQLKELGFVEAGRRGYSASCEYSFLFCQTNLTNDKERCRENTTPNVSNSLTQVSQNHDTNKTTNKTNQENNEDFNYKNLPQNMEKLKKEMQDKGIFNFFEKI